MLAAAGEENAGMLDIGDGWAVVFKIESHNHPSAIEPYQGAATGVGGIHRDVFTMGARPIAALNSLRFGDPTHPKTRHLLKGVVRGIGDYGNAFGVPTVGGEIWFDPCYHTNPLVNAMSVGVVRHGESIGGGAYGVGNPVFIVGSATGKDGIHGATFASQDISEDSAEQLPSVQVGDPFQEKLLLEATLELLKTGAVTGMQDMGAAGVACSTSETAARSGVGMDVWLDKVPMRQSGMKPFEILLSESQERMLVIAQKGREAEVKAVFDKWDLPCEEIGVVTQGPNINYFWHGHLIGTIPAECLVLGGGAPVYKRETKSPAYLNNIAKYNPDHHPLPNDETIKGEDRYVGPGNWEWVEAKPEYPDITRQLLQAPNLASKRWVSRQYDSMVGAGTMTTNFPAAAALVRVPGTNKALALTVDCNPRYVHADPRKGTALAVAEACRNLVCTGATPLGVTNCLNFGNPFNPEVYWQFSEAIAGMKEACERFGLPVTGGNVSFYNQSEDGPVFPTPSIGMVGLLDNALDFRLGLAFENEGDAIYLLGTVTDDMGCSEYLRIRREVQYSPAPYLNLEEEAKLQGLVLALNAQKLLVSANDVSDGGLMLTLLECSFPNGRGFHVASPLGIRKDAFLYGCIIQIG